MNKYNQFNISICSYNVYWQIMKNNSSPLGRTLGKNKIDELKTNILKNISMIKNYYDPYFYCFQETENYSDITNLFDKSTYKFHVNYSKPEYMLTIWKYKIFKKILVIDGEFEYGRPFCVFIFKDLRFSKYFILINIHLGHHHDTSNTLFKPIQKIIDLHKDKISKYNINRIIISGDFNRDIGSQIILEPNKFFICVNSIVFYFIPYSTQNKTCCSLKGYGYNKNYDQIIDTYSQPILIHQLNKESWYIPESSDHLMILSIIKNFI